MEKPSACRISVAVRLRPSSGSHWEMSEKFLADGSGERWRFDEVFGPRASNWDLYERSVQHVIDAFCEGATCTIFACGPRASGKTFTMQGDNSHSPGLVQLAAAQIWEQQQPKSRQLLQVSYLEVADGVKDLLTGADLPRPWQEMTRHTVRSGPEDILRCLLEGNKWRTRRDPSGSRSHTIFLIHMESRSRNESRPCVLSLVDLASWDGEDMGDGVSRSLLALSAFLRGAEPAARPREPLTQLLRRPLEASANVVIVCAISAGSESLEQSRKVLDFFSLGEEDQSANALARLEDEVQALRMSHEGHKELEGRIQALEMEMKELRMKLRMEQESSKSQLASLEERLNVAEQRWDHSKAEPQTAAPKQTDGEVPKDPNPKRRRLEPTERMEAKVGSPHAGAGEDSALHVASELMRRLSAEERMDALIAESHGKPSEKRIPKVPTSLVSRSRRKAPDTSPALLALPAPPTPSRPGESVQTAARVAKVALAEAEERHSRIKQLQQELVRRREALASKATPVERPKIAVEGATEGEVALSELREQLKRKEDEKIEDAPGLHSHQAFLIPRSKSRAQKAFVEQETPAVRASGVREVAQSPASVNSEVKRRDAQAKDEGMVDDPWHVKERLGAPPGRSVATTRHHFTNEAVEEDDQAAHEAAALPNKKAVSMERLKAFDSRSRGPGLQERSHPANLARPFRGTAAPSRMLRSRKDSECQQM